MEPLRMLGLAFGVVSLLLAMGCFLYWWIIKKGTFENHEIPPKERESILRGNAIVFILGAVIFAVAVTVIVSAVFG